MGVVVAVLEALHAVPYSEVNFYSALQRRGDLRWDFTCNGSAVGYCGGEAHRRYHNGENGEKFHDSGHETKAEAEACYHQYLLDNRLRFGEMSGQQRECGKCGAWTSGFAELGMSKMLFLCVDHRTKEIVAELTKPSSQIWSSY